MILIVTGVLHSMSQHLGPDNFDLSLWSNFISSRIQSSLSVGITSVRQSLDILGTRLITEFASCFSTCHDAEWLDVSGIRVQSMELKPPCGASSIVIASSNYLNHQIRLSWNILYAPSAVINLTIEELTLPVLSINCDYSHVKIEDGIYPSIRLCGKQPKQTYYSEKDFMIELIVTKLINNIHMCFSYSYGWYYEAAITGKDIYIPKIVWKSAESMSDDLVYIQLSTPVYSAKGKFLIVTDFLKDEAIIIVNITSEQSIVDIYDGPGRMSPVITRLMEYSDISLHVQFYVYLEFDIISYDSNTSIYYNNFNGYMFPDQND